MVYNLVMKEIAISEFKAKCLALLEQVQKTKKPIRITRFGKPVAEVVPASPASPSDWMGSMKDTIEIVGDVISPANPESDWEALRN
jgi:prevent-host-death family protein